MFEGLFSFEVFFIDRPEAEAEAEADDYFSCLVNRNVITYAAQVPDDELRTAWLVTLQEAELSSRVGQASQAASSQAGETP